MRRQALHVLANGTAVPLGILARAPSVANGFGQPRFAIASPTSFFTLYRQQCSTPPGGSNCSEAGFNGLEAVRSQQVLVLLDDFATSEGISIDVFLSDIRAYSHPLLYTCHQQTYGWLWIQFMQSSLHRCLTCDLIAEPYGRHGLPRPPSLTEAS